MSSSSSTAAASSSSQSLSAPQSPNEPQFYLLKSEPSEYSIDQLRHDGREEWSGIRNFTARKHLSTMRKGDRCFFYHSSCKVPAVVGTCRIARTAQPDETALDPTNVKYHDPKSTTEKNRWLSVLVEYESSFEETAVLTLQELRAQAKTNPTIADMLLLRQGRLSVMSVSHSQWTAVLELQTRKERGEDLLQVDDDNGTNLPNKDKKKKEDGNTRKRNKPAPSASTESTTTLTVEDPGYCSKPGLALAQDDLQAIQSDTAAKITESDLGLRGRKYLYTMDNDKRLICYYEGKKFVGKDKQRLDDMVEAARQQRPSKGTGRGKSVKVYLVLSPNSGICKRNTLPQLLSDGVIVQRLPS